MRAVPEQSRPARIVVLVSGSGTNLQALLDACADPTYGARVVAVGADRDGIEGLLRAEKAGVATFVRPVGEFSERDDWDHAMRDTVAGFEPDLVVLAGFMKLVGPAFLGRFAGRVLNTHPALCPSFPGTSGPADALAYGVKVTGATVHLVDDGVDTGPVLAQAPVEVQTGDTVDELHERIKIEERRLLVETVAALARQGATVSGREVTIP
jgi:phosphoribosylglycinamide formyltransferase-1